MMTTPAPAALAETQSPTPAAARRRRSVTLWRLLRIVAVTLAVGYAAACLFIFLFQKRLMYFPDRVYTVSPADLQLPYESVTLTAADGVRLAAWFIPHDKPRGVVLLCNGNGGNITHATFTAKTLWLNGYAAFVFDYRGYGESQGEVDEAGIYLDAQAAWKYLVEQRRVPPGRIVLFGHSLGGAVAIDLASRLFAGTGDGNAPTTQTAQCPGALIVECTFTSMSEVGQREYPFLPVSLLCTQRFDSLSKIGRVTCPKLFLHGRDDELVPIKMGRKLFAAAAEPKKLIETPGTHNNSGFEHDRTTTQRVISWVERTLPPP